jgi:hypothetical protein
MCVGLSDFWTAPAERSGDGAFPDRIAKTEVVLLATAPSLRFLESVGFLLKQKQA